MRGGTLQGSEKFIRKAFNYYDFSTILAREKQVFFLARFFFSSDRLDGLFENNSEFTEPGKVKYSPFGSFTSSHKSIDLLCERERRNPMATGNYPPETASIVKIQSKMSTVSSFSCGLTEVSL